MFYLIFQIFFIDHSAKTTSFIDPRLPNDLPLLPADSAPPYLLLPNDPNATLLPPPPPRHHGASLTPPPTSRISNTQFDMPCFGTIDTQKNEPSINRQLLMPPSQFDHGTGQNGNSRRRSRSVGEEEITRENIEAVSAATAANASSTRASSTSSHNSGSCPQNNYLWGSSNGSISLKTLKDHVVHPLNLNI